MNFKSVLSLPDPVEEKFDEVYWNTNEEEGVKEEDNKYNALESLLLVFDNIFLLYILSYDIEC